MSKKKTGLLIAFGAALGAAAAGLSYYLKYKSFHDEVEKDFHDYEEDESAEDSFEDSIEEDHMVCTNPDRTYITLDSGKCKSCEHLETCKEEKAPVKDASNETRENISEENSEMKESAPAVATVEEDTEGAN